MKQSNQPRRKRSRPVPDPNAKVWRIQAVVQYTGRSRSSILRDYPEGRFPRPIKIGENAIGFLRVEVEQWLADRIAERDQGAA
jgi:prophage regulatory protein